MEEVTVRVPPGSTGVKDQPPTLRNFLLVVSVGVLSVRLSGPPVWWRIEPKVHTVKTTEEWVEWELELV